MAKFLANKDILNGRPEDVQEERTEDGEIVFEKDVILEQTMDVPERSLKRDKLKLKRKRIIYSDSSSDEEVVKKPDLDFTGLECDDDIDLEAVAAAEQTALEELHESRAQPATEDEVKEYGHQLELQNLLWSIGIHDMNGIGPHDYGLSWDDMLDGRKFGENTYISQALYNVCIAIGNCSRNDYDNPSILNLAKQIAVARVYLGAKHMDVIIKSKFRFGSTHQERFSLDIMEPNRSVDIDVRYAWEGPKPTGLHVHVDLCSSTNPNDFTIPPTVDKGRVKRYVKLLSAPDELREVPENILTDPVTRGMLEEVTDNLTKHAFPYLYTEDQVMSGATTFRVGAPYIMLLHIMTSRFFYPLEEYADDHEYVRTFAWGGHAADANDKCTWTDGKFHSHHLTSVRVVVDGNGQPKITPSINQIKRWFRRGNTSCAPCTGKGTRRAIEATTCPKCSASIKIKQINSLEYLNKCTNYIIKRCAEGHLQARSWGDERRRECGFPQYSANEGAFKLDSKCFNVKKEEARATQNTLEEAFRQAQRKEQ